MRKFRPGLQPRRRLVLPDAVVFTYSYGDADELIAYPSPCETGEGTEIQLPTLAVNGDRCSKGCSRHHK